MAKVKVSGNIDYPNLSKILDDPTIKALETEIKGGIKEILATGRSPVRGKGRFPAYAAQRHGNSTDYPYSVKHEFPNKSVRPVNLKLSGEMIDAIEVIKKGGRLQTATVTIKDPEQRKKAETHNEGTQEPRVPTRKFLPTGEGENFVISIERKILAIIEKRVLALFKRR